MISTQPISNEGDNGFVLDNAGNRRVASIKRGNPISMCRSSIYVAAEDPVGEAGGVMVVQQQQQKCD